MCISFGGTGLEAAAADTSARTGTNQRAILDQSAPPHDARATRTVAQHTPRAPHRLHRYRIVQHSSTQRPIPHRSQRHRRHLDEINVGAMTGPVAEGAARRRRPETVARSVGGAVGGGAGTQRPYQQ